MNHTKPGPGDFILIVFDRKQWCPIYQIPLRNPDTDGLRSLLGTKAADDPDLRRSYPIDEAEAAAIAVASRVDFDLSGVDASDRDYALTRLHSIDIVPYLVHTGYELPLLLDGRKKLARMAQEYPPMTFDGEHRFDHWVAQGVLHREVVIESFPRSIGEFLGIRTVYYTTKGEEWRIPAMKLILEASARSGGWNRDFERLEGMLLGYEDWQNDWWIEVGMRRGPS